MSHQILNAVFSQREGAGWTGLGQVIPADIAKDPRKIAELVGAMYAVEKREAYYKGSDGRLITAPGREVIVRADTDALLGIASAVRYHVANRQPVDIFEAFRDELASEHLEISHAAVLRGGASIAVCATMPAQFDVTVGKNDRIQTYVTLSTGYDTKHGTRRSVGGIRVVCANTLAMSIEDSQADGSLRTLRASTELTETSLRDLLSGIGEVINTEKRTFDALANTKLDSMQLQRYFADVLEISLTDLDRKKANGKDLVSTKARNMLRELSAAYSSAPGAGMATGTAWGALNAVTYYATHVKTVRDMSGSGTEAARVASNMDGDAARLKARALMMAANLAVAA